MPVDHMVRPAAVILPAALFTCILALWAFQAAPVPAGVPMDDSCSIEGRVVNSVTGAPVVQATLMLDQAGGARPNFVYSDDSGQFAVRNLKPGRFGFLARRFGFIPQQFGTTGVVWSGNDPSLLSAGDHWRNLTLRLMPEGVISGRLLDEQGRPLAGASAVVFKRTYENGEEDWRPAGTAKADDAGGFRVGALFEGLYLLAAAPGPKPASASGMDTPPSTEQPETKLIPTYYPGTTDTSSAVPVRVRAGLETRVADLQLARRSTVRVTGKVTGVRVRIPVTVLLSPLCRTVPMLDPLLSKSVAVGPGDGSFVIEGVAPGAYRLWVSLGDLPLLKYNLMQWVSDPKVLQVGGQTVESADVPFAIGESVSGDLSIDGQATPVLDGSFVYLYPSLLPDGSKGIGRFGENGKFRIAYIRPYRYRLGMPKLPEGFYIKSVSLGGQELTGDWLDFKDGVPRAPLRIALSRAGARVHGEVRGRDGQPLWGAIVVLVPSSNRCSLYKKAQTGVNGIYVFGDVPPGEYTILALEALEPGGYLDPGFLSRFQGPAVRLTLSEDDRTEVPPLQAIPFQSQ